MQEPHHKDAVTASVTTESRLRVTALLQKPEHKNAVTVSATNDVFSRTVIARATYAAQWQAKMFYCYFTDMEYDLDEAEIDTSDSEDDTPYGNHREVYRVSGQHREDGLELIELRNWICAFAEMAKGSEWPSTVKSRFGYCPCSHQRSDWRKSNNLYSCYECKDAMDGHSDKFRNCLRDKAPRAPSFKVEPFVAHCKDFSLNRNCPLHFGMYCFLRKLYDLSWPKDMKKKQHLKCIIQKTSAP